MSFAATSIRGARLKARFAVKGIQSSSSDGDVTTSAGAERDGDVGIDVVVMGTQPDEETTDLLRLSDDVNMRAKPGIGEDASMNDPSDDLAEVQRRLQEIQRRKHNRIRWNMSTHTAEIAIEAIVPAGNKPPKSAKQRRRKRHKRLL
jgi:hypothetical protein